MTDEKGKARLITGIKEDAQKEADKIITQVRLSIEEREKTIEKKINRIMNEATIKAKEQAESILKNVKSSIAVEKKRHSLRIRDQLVNMTIDKAKTGIAAMIGKPGYEEVLLRWIIEAALGLNVDEAEVNSSRKEIQYITKELLTKAEKTLLSLTGKKIILKKSQDNPLLAQGVVLTAKDGKTAFNNQVPTRILRYQTEIRKIIYSTLYGEETTTSGGDNV